MVCVANYLRNLPQFYKFEGEFIIGFHFDKRNWRSFWSSLIVLIWKSVGFFCYCSSVRQEMMRVINTNYRTGFFFKEKVTTPRGVANYLRNLPETHIKIEWGSSLYKDPPRPIIHAKRIKTVQEPRTSLAGKNSYVYKNGKYYRRLDVTVFPQM